MECDAFWTDCAMHRLRSRWFMDHVLAGLQWETCLVYLNDIIVLGRNGTEMLERLSQVFGRLRAAYLKLKPSNSEGKWLTWRKSFAPSVSPPTPKRSKRWLGGPYHNVYRRWVSSSAWLRITDTFSKTLPLSSSPSTDSPKSIHVLTGRTSARRHSNS